MKCINCGSKRIECGSDSFTCLDCGQNYPKEYWFISHSHLDIEKVRIVRDVIEEIFFYEPILFFLKCLSDNNEIIDLIKREIDARIWFVYCDSKNARRSSYVRNELDYIQKLIDLGYSKKLITIDLDKFEIWQKGCKKYIREQVFKSLRKNKLFIMPTSDCEFTSRLYAYLIENGYTVFYEARIWSEFYSSVENKIAQYSGDDGLLLAPIDKKTLLSDGEVFDGLKRDTATAIDARAAILPILLPDDDCNEQELVRLFRAKMPALGNRNYVLFDKNDWTRSVQKLENMLKFFYSPI